MMKVSCVFLLSVFVILCLNTCSGQLPPRLNIPGAVLVTQAKPSGFRQARLLDNNPPQQRLRRPIPNAVPIPIREVRPVVEEPEEPSLNSNNFDDEVNKLGLSALQSAVRQAANSEEQDDLPPFRPERPLPVLRQDIREREPVPVVHRPSPIHRQELPQRPILRQEVPQQRPILRQEVPQQRPILRQEVPQRQVLRQERPQPTRADFNDFPSVRQQQPQRQQAPQQVRQNPPPPPPQVFRQPTPRPAPRQHSEYDDEDRTRKPNVQILRKYRTDNPDGSITWGYENEDGSFKEETLGIDCVTKGKYGYVDPDGVKREYNYETGNKCDEPFEDEEELLPERKIVPHGRKPQPQFRPQPSAQY